MTDNLKQYYKEAVKAHRKKKWDEAREKYLAVLDLSPDQKMTKRVNQYLELVKSQKRIPGRSGYYAFAVASVALVSSIILYPIVHYINSYTVPEHFVDILFDITNIGSIVASILIIISFFQAGVSNRLMGIFSVLVFICIGAVNLSYPECGYHPEIAARDKVREGRPAAVDDKTAVAEKNRIPECVPTK